jgi:cytochrome b561
VSWFGLFDIPALPVKPGGPMLGVYHDLHEYAALSMVGLLVLHIGGALKHSLLGKSPGLSRMWFTRRQSQEG